ncbi:putative acyl-CoA dehydrogenase YdbM [Planomonospora parontospora subsp. parontospora]|uniref:Acyl-CoA dehydrogenase YdbM n=2 Tax=Planomonospora parontospora TaxID=58119 RepID=A0AA37F685_9ACTN|nr:acyl-CoA dehydrogenase family protein [Planomonospora parontospora]GGK82702.1 putative acyl-CoA dehydrogenase YdbM [Planomonospora parontospora]GII12202.1 putative acyl-CoA dehydrogenase YdbM [Planomonospora parontospora subsp. parontospora]
MRPLSTSPTRERHVAMAAELAAVFRERAAEYDGNAEFPHRNIDELRDAGYLRLTVPEELGGLGGDLTDMAATQEALASGCASTALTVNMHLSMAGQLARNWRTTGDERARRTLGDIADGKVILMGATAEPGHALVRSTGAKARKTEGGYLVTGDKTFGTGSAVMTHMTSMAVYREHPDGPHVLVFRVPADAPGVRVLEGTWNSSALRATRSENIELRDVMVAEDDVLLSFPVGSLDGSLLQTVWGWAMPTFAAVYLGVAVGALEQCVQDVLSRGWENRPYVQVAISECEALVETSRALIERTAREVMGNALWSSMSIQQGMSRVVLTKIVGTNNAVEVVDRVIRVMGTPALRPGSPYERAHRDVRAGTMHPYGNSDACDLIAATAFGIEAAPANPPRLGRLAEPAPRDG